MSDPTRAEAAAYRAAAPGSLVALQAAVKARMEPIAAAFFGFETKGTPSSPGDPRAPLVFDGWLPPRKSEIEQAQSTANQLYPFLIVLVHNGADTPQAGDQNATATVQIIIGTYSDTDDGWLDVLLLVDAIRQSLGATPLLAGTAFEHIGPLTWEVETKSVRPQWNGVVTTVWTLPRPRRLPTED